MGTLFEAEILKAEVLRTSLLAALFLVALVAFNVVAAFEPQFVREQLGQEFPIREMRWFFLAAFLYEATARVVFGMAQARGWRLPPFGRFVNAFIETGLPGIPIYILSTHLDPVFGLNSPAPYAYPIFVLLSVLRLDARISVFTGVVAGVQYAALYFLLRGVAPAAESTERLMMSAPVYLIRSAMLVFLGLAAAFVASQLRTRILAAFESMHERDQIVGVFGRHVSPEVADRLIAGGADRGETRAVSVLFLDIRGFTSFSESRPPEEVFEFLNTLFAFMIEIVHAHNGIINKFLGDGFMAVFGAPLDSVSHKRESVAAARRIVMALDRKIEAGDFPSVAVGIGIHSGEAMTGNVGSDRRMEYTIIGDVVNLASRLEQMNKEAGTRVLLSGEVYEGLPEAERDGIVFHGKLSVRGREQDVDSFSLSA